MLDGGGFGSRDHGWMFQVFRDRMKHRSNMKQIEAWLEAVGAAAAFRGLVDAVPDAAVFVVDAQRDVLLWSPGAERLLGYRAEEVLGRHCLTGVRCARCLGTCGIAEHGRVADVALELHRADGTPVRVRKWGTAFFDGEGRFAGGIEVLRPEARPEAHPEARPEVPLAPAAGAEVIEFHGIVTRDPAMVEAIRVVRNVAETEATVLVRGESGTGKELVARALHEESRRREGPFVAVNCGALTPSLLESELFGHVRGAFTGASSDRPGIFVQAHGGTLFLDEVAEIPLELQARLLRVLQERTVVPVGGTRALRVDVRIVAATHRALREEVRAGRFREDLMYRLRVVPIFLPALRERPGDLDLLLDRFVARLNERGPRRLQAIEPEAREALAAWRWPGNVRELQNVVEHAFAVGRGATLRLADLPPELREPAAPPAPVEADPAEVLRDALARARGNVNDAAAALGMSRTTFWRQRKRHGV